MAIDTRRQRLLLSGEFLVGYDLTKQKSVLLGRPGRFGMPMVFAPDQDVIYSAQADLGHGRIRAIGRYNFQGALLDWVPLAKPIDSSRHPFDGKQQFVYFDNHLAILKYESDRRGPRRPRQPRSAEGSITVVDLADGAIVYEGPLAPHLERKDLTTDQLETMWQELSRDNFSADEVIWDMAAGHDETVEFLKNRFAALEPPADIDIALLIKDLDSNKFAVRDAAYTELQDLGSRIAPQLERLLNRQVSAEVRASLQGLLKAWESGEPQNATERQHVRGIEVLSRIATPAAREMLREISADESAEDAAGHTAPIVRRLARERLNELEAVADRQDP